MEYPAGPFDKGAFLIGLISAGAGLYFILASAGLAPLPGGRESVNGPMWLLTCAGIAFGLAGISVIIRAVSGALDVHGELPSGTPPWLLLVYALLAPAIVASLAAIGTWFAFGPGERDIMMSAPLFSGPVNDWVGRAAFGIGAIITWGLAGLLLRSVVRKYIRRETL